MDISIDQLLQIIGAEHVKVVLLEQEVLQLKHLLEQTKKELVETSKADESVNSCGTDNSRGRESLEPIRGA